MSAYGVNGARTGRDPEFTGVCFYLLNRTFQPLNLQVVRVVKCPKKLATILIKDSS